MPDEIAPRAPAARIAEKQGTKMNDRIAFIGGGNMANALIGGLIANGASAAALSAVDIAAEQRERLAAKFGIEVSADVASIAPKADTIVLAVKPQNMHEVARQVAPLLKQQLIVTIAAGIGTDALARWLGGYRRIVRVMPNTPALIGAGISGLFARPEVSKAEKTRAEAVLRAVGEILWVESETSIDAVTAVSGSGPAYVFYFIEATRKAALELGFTPEDARKLVLATFDGAVRLAQASDEDVSVLRQRVTSKGGTTERALSIMDRKQVDGAIVEAVHGAMQRAGELNEELGKAGY
jgi:pyrroline-5-carboxylate reductase